MKSTTTDRFLKCFAKLPEEVKKQAKEAYRQFVRDPYYSSLHFKQVHSTRPVFSIRISRDYRAIGILQDSEVVWFWIGSHSEYDGILKKI